MFPFPLLDAWARVGGACWECADVFALVMMLTRYELTSGVTTCCACWWWCRLWWSRDGRRLGPGQAARAARYVAADQMISGILFVVEGGGVCGRGIAGASLGRSDRAGEGNLPARGTMATVARRLRGPANAAACLRIVLTCLARRCLPGWCVLSCCCGGRLSRHGGARHV